MLDALRFVAAAVARKDYVVDLTHLMIRGGRVTGHNGVMTLSSDIDIDLDILPKATQFLSAIKTAEGTISLNMTAAGRLAVRAGKFKSFVDCLPNLDGAEFLEPDGAEIDLGPEFMDGLKHLAPIMGIDASRPWSMGIRLQDASMFATNNVMLAEFWHGHKMPMPAIIPAMAVDQLLRIDETPTKVQVTENAISFWFGEKRWLRTALVDPTQWPENMVTKIFGGANMGNQTPIPQEFKDAVAKLKPFLGERPVVYVTADALLTSINENEGTSVEVPIAEGIETQLYSHRQLELLAEVASSMDWNAYPNHGVFRSERLRGVMVGQRL